MMHLKPHQLKPDNNTSHTPHVVCLIIIVIIMSSNLKPCKIYQHNIFYLIKKKIILNKKSITNNMRLQHVRVTKRELSLFTKRGLCNNKIVTYT